MSDITDQVINAGRDRKKEEKRRQPSSLVLQEPQLKSAKAELQAAKAKLSQAKLDLERTDVKAPFDCFVRSKSFDVGQFLQPGVAVANLFSSDAVEIIVPVTSEEVQRVNRARIANNSRPLKATVELKAGEVRHHWDGLLVRVLGNVDTRGRMHRVVVEVLEPYFQSVDGFERTRLVPLSVGSFADVTIEAGSLSGVIPVPRVALRRDSRVWVVDENSKLKTLSVRVAYSDSSNVYIEEGLPEGSLIVLTKITAAVDGMLLRVAEM
ncbi:hypothetical protein BVY02_00060 [bacterium J17]|nr:hypothetical protein BVY02_00060 [bacterium J17]